MIRRFFIFLATASIASVIAWASPQPDSYSRIARLSYLEGQVSFQHASEADWAAASINFPLQPGDRVYTGKDGRAEIEFDDGSVFRLAENTDVELLSLQEDLIQLRVFSGLSTLTVSSNLEFEVDTPAAAFNTLRKGAYRFNVVENGTTDAIVREGELEAANNRFSRHLRSGDLLHVEPGEYGLDNLYRYSRQDRWDDWTDRRDERIIAYSNSKYIPAGVFIGSSELRRYGRWVEVSSYGFVWTPLNMDASWTPYSLGRWCYRPLWGWTWVSYEPWGWLPYHYGRWHHNSRYGWCWIPGAAFSFNFWSPGLVAFYQGPGWISWGPLGPGDYYNVDNYHFNRRLYSYELVRLRALHTRRPNEPFNRNVRGAFRIAEIDHFRNGVFSDRDRNRVRDGNSRWGNLEPWRNGSPVRDRLSVQPTAVSYSANPMRSALRPAKVNTMPAMARSVPTSRSANRSGLTRITTPRGAGPNRQDRDRSRDGRLETVTPRNQPRDNRPENPEPRNQQSPSKRQAVPRSNTSPATNNISEPSSRQANSGNAPQPRPGMTQPPSVPQRQTVIQQSAPVPQTPPRSQDSGTVRRFGTPRPPDSAKASESRSQERSRDRAAPEVRKSNEGSSPGGGKNDNKRSEDGAQSNQSDSSNQSGRRARPR